MKFRVIYVIEVETSSAEQAIQEVRNNGMYDEDNPHNIYVGSYGILKKSVEAVIKVED